MDSKFFHLVREFITESYFLRFSSKIIHDKSDFGETVTFGLKALPDVAQTKKTTATSMRWPSFLRLQI